MLASVAVLAGGFFALNSYIYEQKQGGVEDPKDVTFTIDGQTLTRMSPGVAYFGNEAKGDLNDDTVPDIAFLITYDGGGSGTFYYVVAALQNPAGRYNGSNAVLLGDRVAPQTSEVRNGILIVNYADRKPGESFTTQPSIGISKYIIFDGVDLIAIPVPGRITIEGRMVCLPHRDTEGPQTMECAFGLLDDEERYFALSDTDPEYTNVAGVPMNERVRVEGAFKLHLNSNYQDIGVIEVTRITTD